jgi:CRISPR-associated endonuclease Cas2
MLFIVAYDIPDDGTRSLIADELQNWGHRVQYSVFECDLDEKRAGIVRSTWAVGHSRPTRRSIRYEVSPLPDLPVVGACQNHLR